MKNNFKKLAATILAVGITFFPNATFVSAFFYDWELGGANSWQGAVLDLSLDTSDISLNLTQPSPSASKDVKAENKGTIGFNQDIKTENLTGTLCPNLELSVLFEATSKFTGDISALSINTLEFATGTWSFGAKLKDTSASWQSQKCEFDIVFDAYQLGFAKNTAWTDTEKVHVTVNSGTWVKKGVWTQTTVDDFNAGVSSYSGDNKEIAVNTPGDASIAAGGIIPPVMAGFSRSNDTKHEPSLAIDGDIDTYWHSKNANDGDTFWVDLGQKYYVAQVKINFKKVPDQYTISVSDNSTSSGSVVATITGNSNSEVLSSFPETSARYIMLKSPKINGTIGIREFEVLKRAISAFDGIATLTSQTFDSQEITKWTKLEWTDTLPSGTNVKLSVQTSNDGSNWSTWKLQSDSSPIDLSSLPQTRYIRWQAELSTNTLTPPITTPILHEVSVYYEQEQAQKMILMNEILPNPAGTFGEDTSVKPSGEWIELYSQANSKVDLYKFYFMNSNGDKVYINSATADSTEISNSDWLVVYMNSDFMKNSGDTIGFYDLWGNKIDEYTFDTTNACSQTPTPDASNADTSTGSCTEVPENKSIARIPDGSPTWIDPIPTPGKANILEEVKVVENILDLLTGEGINTSSSVPTSTTSTSTPTSTATTSEEAITPAPTPTSTDEIVDENNSSTEPVINQTENPETESNTLPGENEVPAIPENTEGDLPVEEAVLPEPNTIEPVIEESIDTTNNPAPAPSEAPAPASEPVVQAPAEVQ